MPTPSFTAETSLYRTARSFRPGRAALAGSMRILPMQNDLDADHCGNCHCRPGAKCHVEPNGFCHCHPPGHEAARLAPDPVFLTR